MSLLGSSLALLALTALIFGVVRPRRFRHIGWLAALPPAAITVWLFTQIPAIAAGQVLTERIPWAGELGLELSLRLDGLALLFGLIITGIGAGVTLYTGYYFEDSPRLGYFYSLLFAFMASMLGLVWADNLLLLFAFWEGTSYSSYLLIAFDDGENAAREGGRRALLVTALGGLAMLFGMVLLGSSTGSYTISEILATPGLTRAPFYPWALALLLLGAFTKSAQFPFHFWLPGAMAAPTPASAYLHSATMVKAGVYLLARLHPALADDPRWFWALLLVGGITMLVGAITALGQYDMKALLAYATVSQLGILVMLLAFNSEQAVIAVAVGILAHALYKGPLFLLAGIVDHATGTRDLRRLGHLRRELPLVTAVALLAELSMAGIPPFFGFLAKETLLETFYHHAATGSAVVGWIGMGVAALGGAFFVAYSFTLLWEGFLRGRAEQDTAHVHHPPSLAFVLTPLILTLIGSAIPYLLGPTGNLLDAPASDMAGETVDMHLALWHGWTPVLMTSLAAIATGLLIFLGRSRVRAALRALPARLSGDALFDQGLAWLQRSAVWLTRAIQGGALAQQASVTLGAAVVALGFAVYAAQWPQDFRVLRDNSPSLAELILAVLGAVAAIATVRAPSRLSAIISSGVVGIVITLFFVFFNAPDLALTQLLVDVLTVVLLVLVFYRIPPRPLPPFRRRIQFRNLLVALAVGALGFSLTLLSAGPTYAPAIGDWFSLNSVALGHGANIVNVILVDFRGFDTLGEITVLAIAAVGGYSILRSLFFRPRPLAPATPSAGRQPIEKPLENKAGHA
ncbi:MAG: DUF4040 domain-containing protein [Caldilineaceae bacterium]|nr:DUF4040 domain-containing protein [Caldilineaceae bacterium]